MIIITCQPVLVRRRSSNVNLWANEPLRIENVMRSYTQTGGAYLDLTFNFKQYTPYDIVIQGKLVVC